MEASRRAPAAVSGSRAVADRERDVERIGWEPRPARRRASAAAVSVRELGPPERAPQPSVGVAGPAPGRYAGLTDEALPRAVEFRFLGRGIRDLVVGDRLVARWISVSAGDARATVNATDVRLAWTGARDVSGAIVRRRRGRPEVLRFTASQQFHRFAG